MLFELIKEKRLFKDEKGENVEFYQLFIINKELNLKFPICSSWSKTNEKTQAMYQLDTRILKSLADENIAKTDI